VIEIDGSLGEGGGQILRTALSLSCLTQAPFRMLRIRRNRSKPGLQPQHLTAVRALKTVCQADVEGDRAGSQDLVFRPRRVVPGRYDFDIGTAGSTSLLLQALLPPLLFADAPSTLQLVGGTHVRMSPPFDYLQSVFFPFLHSIGITASVSMERHGFYPQGGGRMGATVMPVDGGRNIPPVQVPSPPFLKKIRGVSAVANLPIAIAERQRDAAMKILQGNGVEAEVDVRSVSAFGRGTYIFLGSMGKCAAGFSSVGERGKRAEAVGAEAAQELVSYKQTEACLDPHLADQVLIYLSLAAGRSTFTTSMITEHLITNLATIERFLSIDAEIRGRQGDRGAVTVKGVGFKR